MDHYLNLNLIAVFTFYLWAAFFLSMVRRLTQYRDFTQLALGMPNRWPKTLGNIRRHGLLFMTWATLRPAAVAIVLLTIQLIASKIVWPTAHLTANNLRDEWWMIPVLAILAAAMVAVDAYGILRVGRLDRKETEKYLDEAEHWLTSWKAPLLSAVTLGYVNPREMVDKEVRKAVEYGNSLVQSTFWWMSLQSGLRLLFGIALWLSWAML